MTDAYLQSGMAAWPHADYDYPYPTAAQQPFNPFAPVDSSWDPAEELAYLLKSQAAAEAAPFVGDAAPRDVGEELPAVERLAGLTEITDELPRVRAPHGHRRVRQRRPAPSLLQRVSYLIVGIAAVIVSMVSALGGIVTYDPLRRLSGVPTAYGVGFLWPVLIYGPWVVATLSILRAALHRRRAAHSWSVVLFFSGVAMLLCVAQSPRNFTGAATAALPPLAALACFQQLVRQITLTRPPRGTLHRRRSSAPLPHACRHPKQKTGT
jgi:hypothetical protein